MGPGALLDDSGGLSYHLRALRYRRTLWQPFTQQVACWLQQWQPPGEELVIIGPNAGYTLDADFLRRFARICILEPDPLARWLLARRFPTCRFEHEVLDCCAGIHGPAMLRARFPQAAFLFSNLLGQVIERLDPRWPAALQDAMQGANWASYHDLVACRQAPQRTRALRLDTASSLEAIIRKFWTEAGALQVHDHGSFGVLPARACAPWSLTPRQHHLVAWTSMTVVGSSRVMPPMMGMGGRS